METNRDLNTKEIIANYVLFELDNSGNELPTSYIQRRSYPEIIGYINKNNLCNNKFKLYKNGKFYKFL